jgi:DHA2 family multidrug resistance protein
VLTAYILTLGVVTPTSAFFSDRWGIKRFYIISLVLFTVGSALCGLAWSLPTLIFFRILQGIGGAALFPMSITLLFREFPPHERGTAMGLFGIPALLAPAIGPTLGGYLVTSVDWQLIFYINVPVGIIAVILASVFLRESRPEAHLSFDVLGFVFAALGLAMVLYGLSDASTDGWGSSKILGLLIGGSLVLVMFVVTEIIIANRGGQPLLDLRLFTNGPFRASNIANLFVVFSLFGGLFLFPIYLQNLRGLSAFQSGLLLLPQALASMVSVVAGGRLVDRIGVRAVMIPGLLALAIVNWQLAFITLYTPFWWLQFMLIVRGLAFGLVVQPLTVAALSEIPPRQLNQASSINTVVRSVSSSLGIAILATLVQTQSKIHYTHLAEQVTATSPLGQLVSGLQAAFVARGADTLTARITALQLIARFVQRQAYMLAIQDAFLLTVAIIGLAIIAVLFVRGKRRPAKPAPPSELRPVVSAEAEEPASPVLALVE